MMAPDFYLTLSATALAGLAMLVMACLSGWRSWLALKHQELGQREAEHAPIPSTAGARIEIADLKERIRKLEAIAAGVDL